MMNDLTVGKPEAVLWKFCMPLFGSIVFQQLYNIADSFVAGKFIGENALAAVGNSYEISLIFIAFIDEPTALTLQTGIEFLRILSPFYFVISMKFVADGILRGAGMMGKFMVTTFLDLILRVGIAVLLSRTILGAAGIWCAWPIGWIVAVILSLAFYKSGRWNDL